MTRVAVSILLLVALVAPVAPAAAQRSSRPMLAFEREIQGSDEQDVRWPVALASGPDGELAVADAHGARLLLFRSSGPSWSLASTVELPSTPVGLAWDGGRYLVSLRGGSGLMALGGEGAALRPVELPGAVEPGGLASRPGGGAVLYDYAGRRVLQLSSAGEVVSEAAVEGRVTAVAGTTGGGFFTAVGERGEIRRHAPDGSVRETWTVRSATPVPAWPAALAVAAGGEVWVADRHNGRILLYRTDGELVGVGSRSGWEPGMIRFPAALDLLPEGRIAVADQGNGRIQIFRRVEGGSER